MNNVKNRLEFINVFPTIIGKDRLPEDYLSLITSVTDKLFDKSDLSGNLDYSKKTTTMGGKQVILFGDRFNKDKELKDPAWQNIKNEIMHYIAGLCRHYAWNLFSTQAPWLVNANEESYQAMPRNMWVVSQQSGDYNAMHVHPVSNVSGIFYLKVPECVNASTAPDGCVAFWNNTSLDPLNLQIGGETTMIPRVGDMYLFPSRLPHVVYPYRGEGERRSVSFNFIVSPPGQA